MVDWKPFKNDTLLSIVTQCFRDNSLYIPPIMLVRLMSSIGCHLFNLANFQSRTILDGPYPRNYRMSTGLFAPSGYCKSTFLKFLFHKTGLFNRKDLPCDVRGTFTPQCWVGTRLTREEDSADPVAVFARFATGMVAAEEFARLVDLMDSDGREPDEVYLLQGLDTPYTSKEHCLGVVEHEGICTSIYPALRPPAFPMRMVSGLGRRLTWDLQLPGPYEFGELEKARRKGRTQGTTHSFSEYRAWVQTELIHIMSGLGAEITPLLDLTEIHEWISQHRQPPFIADILERLAIGYSIVNGTYPEIPVTTAVDELFRSEILNRRVLKSDCMSQAVRNIIQSHARQECTAGTPRWVETEIQTFLMDYYQLSYVQARGAVASAVGQGLVEYERTGILIAPPHIIDV